MNERERSILIEQVTTAWRPVSPHGELRAHPTWHDLDAAGRVEVFRATEQQRALEAAADARGLSTTAHAVLARIRA